MSESTIVSNIQDRIGIVRLNRPDAMNAFTDDMRELLLDTLSELASNDAVNCIVLTGSGRAFCAGGDIDSMTALQAQNDTDVIERRMSIGAQVVRLLRTIDQPTIAAINGAAAGAGMNLALACDLRIGSSRMLFSESFVKIGLVPDWGGFYLLPRIVGTAKAMELMMTGDRIDAESALSLGLVNRIVPETSFESEWMAFAKRLASGPSETLGWIKRGVNEGALGSLSDALAFEYEAQKRLFLSENAREGMQAFVDKRPPQFASSPTKSG